MPTLSHKEMIFDYLYSHTGWNNVIDIIRDLFPNCVNVAVRSRISDLNKEFLKKSKPWAIKSKIDDNGVAAYKLICLDENGQYNLQFGQDKKDA